MRDEIAPIGQINVVRAIGEHRFGNAVVLSLKRANTMNHDAAYGGTQRLLKISRCNIERNGANTEFVKICRCGRWPPPGSDDFNPGRCGERAANTRTKIAVAA